MAKRRSSLVENLLHRAGLSRWSAAARGASEAELTQLRRDRFHARQLRGPLDQFLATAEGRLALPRIGSSTFPQPRGTDWAWRPNFFRGSWETRGLASIENKSKLGSELTLFHDCATSEISARQLRNSGEDDLAPFGLRMDVFGFDGSFLSLVFDLPDEACAGLKKRHVVRADLTLSLERPVEVFARLNVRNGPNTEQIVREVPLDETEVFVEFDLAYTNLNERRVERMWVDLIFEGTEMNLITMRDLTFTRYPRAEL